MFSPTEMLMVIAVLVLPPGICALLARSDARKRHRQLARQVIIVAALLTAISIALFIFAMIRFALQPRPVGIGFGINWFGFAIAHIVMFIGATAFGSLGYLVGYRVFQDTGPEGAYGGEGPVQRIDETGNPYQPPST